MTRDGFDWFSIVASILGILTVIQLCRVVWNRAVYVVSFILGSAAFGLIGFPGILPTQYRIDVKTRVDRLYRDLAPFTRIQAAAVPDVLVRKIADAEQSVIIFGGHNPVVADPNRRSLEKFIEIEGLSLGPVALPLILRQDPTLEVLNQLEKDLEDIVRLLSVRSKCSYPQSCRRVAKQPMGRISAYQ